MEQNKESYEKWLERLVEKLRGRVVWLTQTAGLVSPHDDLHRDMLAFDARSKRESDIQWLRDEIEREKQVRRMNDDGLGDEIKRLWARVR